MHITAVYFRNDQLERSSFLRMQKIHHVKGIVPEREWAPFRFVASRSAINCQSFADSPSKPSHFLFFGQEVIRENLSRRSNCKMMKLRLLGPCYPWACSYARRLLTMIVFPQAIYNLNLLISIESTVVPVSLFARTRHMCRDNVIFVIWSR